MTADIVLSVLRAWRSGKSALLYGPPATGKTLVMTQLMAAIDEEATEFGSIGLNASDSRNPFQGVSAISNILGAGLPQPVKKVWLTFHQSLAYEDFVIGLAPRNSADGIELVPHAGVLTDAIAELQDADGAKSIVIFIDEINRGNAAKIFGEFLTFLDFDYRDSDATGVENPQRVPLPLRHLKVDGDSYEEVIRQDGSPFKLRHPSYFPRHIYVVATMNSVDRTAIPIDSALARRFDRIDMRPDLNLLMQLWGIEASSLASKAATPSELTPAECAVLIMDRVNLAIAENFGTDFELGHGLAMSLKPSEADAWDQLARLWDTTIFPQIEDRFSGRLEELASLLRVDEFSSSDYAWKYRESITGQQSTSALSPATLSKLPVELSKSSFQRLGSQQPPS